MSKRHVIIDTGMATLEGYIDADADLDGTFRFECIDTGEVLNVNGWLADSIEDVDPGRSCCNGCGCAECEPDRAQLVSWGMA